jgi:hypothetical protein
MKVQSINSIPNYGNCNRSNLNFEGSKGKIVAAAAGSSLLTAAFVTTSAVTGPIGWLLGAWIALAGGIGGAAAESGIEDKIKELRNDKSKGPSGNLNTTI